MGNKIWLSYNFNMFRKYSFHFPPSFKYVKSFSYIMSHSEIHGQLNFTCKLYFASSYSNSFLSFPEVTNILYFGFTVPLNDSNNRNLFSCSSGGSESKISEEVGFCWGLWERVCCMLLSLLLVVDCQSLAFVSVWNRSPWSLLSFHLVFCRNLSPHFLLCEGHQ